MSGSNRGSMALSPDDKDLLIERLKVCTSMCSALTQLESHLERDCRLNWPRKTRCLTTWNRFCASVPNSRTTL
jgi:hypothetical protein